MSQRKRVVRFYSILHDEQEERWLEQMALSGWHLVGGPILYTFEKGKPQPVRYRLDYLPRRKGLQDYLRLCEDAGWEHVLQFAGWQYWRTSLPEAPEIYTDAASRIEKYQRLFTVCLLLVAAVVAANLNTLLGTIGGMTDSWLLGLRCFVLLVLAVWAYILVRLGLRIRHLKQGASR